MGQGTCLAAGFVGARVGLGMVASLALVASIVSPIQVQAAPLSAEAIVLPAPESTPADARIPSVPEGDFSVNIDDLSTVVELPALEAKGKRFSAATFSLTKLDLDELTVLDRDEYTTTFDLPGGSEMVEVTEHPQNVRVGGEWVSVDTAIEPVDGGWVTERHSLAPEFALRSGGEVLTVRDDDVSLSWRLLGAADVLGTPGKDRTDGPQALWYRDAKARHRRRHSISPGGSPC